MGRAARPPAAAHPPTSASDASAWGEGQGDPTTPWPAERMDQGESLKTSEPMDVAMETAAVN